MHFKHSMVIAALATGALVAAARPEAQQAQDDKQSFRFRTGVELINVTATVTDASGRFVPNLRKEDFRVYQDDQEQPVTHFNSERVPVSLGIALDTSGSMAGEKMAAARDALDRFLYQLLDPSDEVFLYRFDSSPELIDGWTTDRRRISDELARMQPRGSTALYDAVAEAVPLAQAGRNRKKALVVISDGNDTSSRTDILSLKQLIRETEVLVYAIGIDAQGGVSYMPVSATTGISSSSSGRVPRGSRSRRLSPVPEAGRTRRRHRPRGFRAIHHLHNRSHSRVAATARGAGTTIG